MMSPFMDVAEKSLHKQRTSKRNRHAKTQSESQMTYIGAVIQSVAIASRASSILALSDHVQSFTRPCPVQMQGYFFSGCILDSYPDINLAVFLNQIVTTDLPVTVTTYANFCRALRRALTLRWIAVRAFALIDSART